MKKFINYLIVSFVLFLSESSVVYAETIICDRYHVCYTYPKHKRVYFVEEHSFDEEYDEDNIFPALFFGGLMASSLYANRGYYGSRNYYGRHHK